MEFVYVVPRSQLFGDHYPQGLVPFGAGTARETFVRSALDHGFFVERDYAEHHPDWKQVIPYTVVTRGGRILCLRRTRAGGEGRLHDKLSIGVGGHINPVDAGSEGPAARASATAPDGGAREHLLESAAARELAEELVLEGDTRIEPVGLINDDSNAVGAVHVGLVQILSTEEGVGIREREVLEGDFVTPAELHAMRAEGANFETWSAMLVDRIEELLSHVPLPTPAALS